MPDDKITQIPAPPDSVEETAGIKTTAERLYPGIGLYAAGLNGTKTPQESTVVAIHVYVVKPTLSGTTWTYSRDEEITGMLNQLDWEFNRRGGLGAFKCLLVGDIESRAKQWGDERWEIEIEIRLSTETTFSTWYRGIIEEINVRRIGNEAKTELAGAGYTNELRKISVSTYFSAPSDIRTILISLLDTNITGANSRILKNTGKLIPSANAYSTVSVVTLDKSAWDCIRALADLQGSIQWGVDINREFYFLQESASDIDQDHIFTGNDLVSIDHRISNWKNITGLTT